MFVPGANGKVVAIGMIQTKGSAVMTGSKYCGSVHDLNYNSQTLECSMTVGFTLMSDVLTSFGATLITG